MQCLTVHSHPIFTRSEYDNFSINSYTEYTVPDVLVVRYCHESISQGIWYVRSEKKNVKALNYKVYVKI